MNNTAQEDMAEKISAALLGSGHEIVYYDKKGNRVFSPEEANRIWSDLEKMMIVIGKTKGRPKRNLATFYTSDVTDPEEFNNIKTTLKRHNIYDFSFDTEPFDKTLEPRHFKHMNVHETWSGSTRTSYFPVDSVNVVVKHTKPWDKESLGDARRWQRIKKIMLFTPDGERFVFPHNNIVGAKAMAQHLHQGKSMWDVDGKMIQQLATTLKLLRGLQSKASHANCVDFANQISTTRGQIKKLLKTMSRGQSYDTSVQGMYEWAKNWVNQKQNIEESIQIIHNRSEMILEARQLAEWYDSFDVRTILENEEKLEQVRTAWEQSNGDIYTTLDVLKRNFPGWESRFEDDPQSVTKELEQLVAKIKNENQ